MLLGPSGCGKTTTLRMIAGLELADVRRDLTSTAKKSVATAGASERDIAFVFQMFALYPHLNVRNNIGYPLVSQGMAKRGGSGESGLGSRVCLGSKSMLDRPVSGLSGGDRQRVALGARHRAGSPSVILMDEPLGALDAEFRERMAEELRNAA